MYAIDDFTEANGGTTLVPGSHVSTDPVNQEAERVAVAMSRGSVLAWDGATWHGGGRVGTTGVNAVDLISTTTPGG